MPTEEDTVDISHSNKRGNLLHENKLLYHCFSCRESVELHVSENAAYNKVVRGETDINYETVDIYQQIEPESDSIPYYASSKSLELVQTTHNKPSSAGEHEMEYSNTMPSRMVKHTVQCETVESSVPSKIDKQPEQVYARPGPSAGKVKKHKGEYENLTRSVPTAIKRRNERCYENVTNPTPGLGKMEGEREYASISCAMPTTKQSEGKSGYKSVSNLIPHLTIKEESREYAIPSRVVPNPTDKRSEKYENVSPLNDDGERYATIPD